MSVFQVINFKKTKSFLRMNFLIILGLFSFNQLLVASNLFQDDAEKALYEQGIALRKENNFSAAIEYFKPLAEKKYSNAQHNLGSCYFQLGDDRESYNWFKAASNQGFELSSNNIARINTLYLLLSDKHLMHIGQFFDLRDLCNFSLVSRKGHNIVQNLIMTTDFLNSGSIFAQDFRNTIISNMNSHPQPQQIRVFLSAKSSDGSIEIHFRDTNHLRQIVERTPLISGHNLNCYEMGLIFVHNKNAKDYKELQVQNGKIKTGYFIHVISEEPLEIQGDLNIKSYFHLPTGSKFKILSDTKFSTGSVIQSYANAIALADSIDTFNEDLLRIRSNEAIEKIDVYKRERINFPEKFPDLQILCPKLVLISPYEHGIIQKDYIDSTTPLLYIGKSTKDLEELHSKSPSFCKGIFLISQNYKQNGIYSENSLNIKKGFEFHNEHDLIMFGELESLYPNYETLSFEGKGKVWVTELSIAINSMKLLTCMTEFNTVIQFFDNQTMAISKKPDQMPDQLWEKFITYRLWKEILEYGLSHNLCASFLK